MKTEWITRLEQFLMSEWDSPSRYTELVATKHSLVVRVPWAEDYYGRSIVDLNSLEVE